MIGAIKSGIKRVARRFGVNISRVAHDDPFALQRRILGIDSPLIFDVGAYVGDTIARYREVFESPNIIGFEPFPKSYETVSARFGGVRGVEIIDSAVGEDECTRSFYCNLAPDTNSLLPASNEAGDLWGEALRGRQVIEADCVSLDRFCADRGIAHVDIVKLDIQGAEMQALRGTRKLLQAQAISMVFLECILHATYRDQAPMHELLGFMSRYGYQLQDICDPVRIGGRLVQCDLLFVSGPLRAEPGP